MQACRDVSRCMASLPHFCTVGNLDKSQVVHLRSPPDLYHTRRLAFCTRQDEHASMSQSSATHIYIYILSLPHMCTLGSPGKSPDDHLRSAFYLYHARVISQVLVKQEMIMCGRGCHFLMLLLVLERSGGQACMWPDTQRGIGGRRCVQRAKVWGSSSRVLARCVSSS